MKIRNIPFGYKYDNGRIEHDQFEMQVYLRMTNMYIDGMSLKDIADTLNREDIEYAPGLINWNKSRIMRLLSDERYTGIGKFPAIISKDIYDLILAKRNNNSLLSDTDLHSEIYKLNIPVICSNCGKPMKRKRADSKKAHKCWNCPSCAARIYIDDENLIAGIEKRLMQFIYDPNQIRTENISIIKDNYDIDILFRDIEEILERPDIRIDLTIEKIQKLAALRYKAISEQYYIALRLKADFQKSCQLCDYLQENWKASMIDLANRTIREIHISDLGQVSIVLINGQTSPKGA